MTLEERVQFPPGTFGEKTWTIVNSVFQYDARLHHCGAEMPLGSMPIELPQPQTLTLTDGTREAVIDLTGEAVTYSGDLPVDESAKIFCGAVYGELRPKTCKTCCFFESEFAREGCICPKMIYGCGRSNADADGVNIENDEGWGMVPGPDFGCIHHRVRV